MITSRPVITSHSLRPEKAMPAQQASVQQRALCPAPDGTAIRRHSPMSAEKWLPSASRLDLHGRRVEKMAGIPGARPGVRRDGDAGCIGDGSEDPPDGIEISAGVPLVELLECNCSPLPRLQQVLFWHTRDYVLCSHTNYRTVTRCPAIIFTLV